MNGCSQSSDSEMDLFQYKGSYVGDNSAVGNIVNNLAHNEELIQIALETTTEPYGMILKYKDLNMEREDKNLKEIVISNSTFIFTLIENVDWITFQFPDEEFTVTKEKLQEWYNNKLDQLDSEQEVKKLIQEKLKSDDDVNHLFTI